MDESYVCPDCHAEHRQPQDAVLGHLARCRGCAIAEDIETAERERHDAPEIGVAA